MDVEEAFPGGMIEADVFRQFMNFVPQTLERIRRRLRRLTLTRGIALSCIALMVTLLAIGHLDYLVRWSSPGLSWLATLTAATTFLGSLAVLLVWPLMARLTPLEIALRIERHSPSLKGALSTFVCLQERGDASEQLVALQSELACHRNLLEQHPEDRFLIGETSSRVQGLLAVVLTIWILAILVFAPVAGQTALARIVRPWHAPPWPLQTRLVVLDEHMTPVPSDRELAAVAGEPLRLYVVDREGAAPLELNVTIQHGSRRRVETISPQRQVNQDGQLTELFPVTIVPDTRQTFVRADGGDDQSMPWVTIRGSSPPRIVRSTTTVVPPEHAAASMQTLPELPARLAALQGSKLSASIEVDRPLKSARLVLQGQPPRPLKLDESRRRFGMEIAADVPGRLEYTLELVDTRGLSESRPPVYELIAQEDRLPEVEIVTPDADLLVTPLATLKVRATATDDTGLKSLTLLLAAEEGGPPIEMQQATPDPVNPRVINVDQNLELRQWPLQAGKRYDLIARAEDVCPRDENTDAAGKRRLVVVTEEELLADLYSRQLTLAHELLELRSHSQRELETVRQLRIQQDGTGGLRSEDLEQLAVLLDRLRTIAAAFDQDGNSLLADAGTIRGQYEANHLLEEQAAAILLAVVEELRLLDAGPVTELRRLAMEVDQSLADEQDAEATERMQPVVVPQVSAIDLELSRTVAALDSVAVLVEEWRQRANVSSDLTRVIADFQSLHGDTIRLGQRTLAAQVDSLTDQDRAELAKLGDRQRTSARSVEKLLADLSSAATIQPYLAAAVGALEQSRIPERLLEGVKQLERNSIGEVVTLQSAVAGELQVVDRLLRGVGTNSTDSLLHKISQAESDVASFRSQSATLVRDWLHSESLSADQQREELLQELAAEHEELTLRISRLATNLRLDRLSQPARLLDDAAARTHAAREELGDGRRSNDRVPQLNREADNLLEQASEQLKASRQQLELEAIADSLWQLSAATAALAGRQTGLADETARLDGLVQRNGRLSRAELGTLRQTTVAQSDLASEVRALAGAWPDDGVFALTLTSIATDMDQSATELDSRQTGAVVIDRQRDAANRLSGFSESLKLSLAGNSSRDNDEITSPDAGTTEQSTTQSLARVAELQLLLDEQKRLLKDTMAAREMPANDPGRAAKFSSLSRRQRQVTQWLDQLMQSLPEAAQSPHGDTHSGDSVMP